jgi:NAD(P)-dependent dehydrogenase (short-subunit alcohol dehydrogenase family)
MRLEDKVAIVAGVAWGGIGAMTACRFAQEGLRQWSLPVAARTSCARPPSGSNDES